MFTDFVFYFHCCGVVDFSLPMQMFGLIFIWHMLVFTEEMFWANLRSAGCHFMVVLPSTSRTLCV